MGEERVSEVKLLLGDCLELMKDIPDKSIDAVITDPPYPDYYADEYKYFDGILEPLNKFKCRQLVFWTAKVDFPLDYTAIHIWDKWIGAGSQYERIFDRNGGKEYKVFKYAAVGNETGKNEEGTIVREIIKAVFGIDEYGFK